MGQSRHFDSALVTPICRHFQYLSACLKGATNGLMHRSKKDLFDHLIGANK
jgi:hypothetical protein